MRIFLLSSLIALATASTSFAGFLFTCGDNSPAVPVPEFRDGVRLWPERLRPADPPGRALPGDRDSTDRTGGNTAPNASTGHELFKAFAIEDDVLFVAYSLGVQAWDIGPGYANRPRRLTYRDLWRAGDFLLPPPGNSEQFHFINDVDALRPAAGGPIRVAAAGKVPFVGPVFWTYERGMPFRLHYQDAGDGANGGTNALQGALAEVAGRTIYVAVGGPVVLYDVDAATTLTEPCLDNRGSNPACGPVRLGVLPAERARFVDARAVGDRLLIALGGDSEGVRLIEIKARPDGTLLPEDAVTLASTGGFLAGAVALFDHNGRSWLGMVEVDRIEVYDITGCVEGIGCALTTPEWRSDPIPFWSEQFLTASSSRGVPYLYYGVNAHELSGSSAEKLFDLRALGTSNVVTDVAATGGSVFDLCSLGIVDYWSAYYGGNTEGLRGVEPHQGIVHNGYFYRAAETVFDVHVLDESELLIDGFESGGTQAWSASTSP